MSSPDDDDPAGLREQLRWLEVEIRKEQQMRQGELSGDPHWAEYLASVAHRPRFDLDSLCRARADILARLGPQAQSQETPHPEHPADLAELATAIRSKSPSKRRVPNLLDLIASKMEGRREISLHFDDIRECSHAGVDVGEDAVEKTIQDARKAITGLPYSLHQSGHYLIVRRNPS
jgi:hypothetical protein